MSTIKDREETGQALRRQLSNGGNVLVVGAKSTNFNTRIREHPRIVVWDSTDPQIATRTPPDNTRVIVCLRFISHSIFARLMRYARKKHLLMMPGLANTGEVKDVLEIALNIEPAIAAQAIASLETPEPAATTPPEEPHMAATSTSTKNLPAGPRHTDPSPLRLFLQEHIDYMHTPAREAERLFNVAQAGGFPNTTMGAVSQHVYKLRRLREAAGGSIAPSKPGNRFTVKTQTRRAVQPQPAPLPLSGGHSNVEEALRLIDEAAAVLGLVREAVQKVSQDDQATRETVAELQSYLTRLRGEQPPAPPLQKAAGGSARMH